ncbi:hypothetical protein SO802_021186 [Lithocarpus litseifolius]|uniref:Inhibitor I9 domain-containing protein n=1 Tax=Lithocarpus litseifolius TaxID=425828 RepID=A0AAW2CE16_9ROSI
MRERDGFSAFLTQSEANTIGKNPLVLAVFKDRRRELHTTQSPQFLGLRNQRGLWSDFDYGSDVIIRLLNTGLMFMFFDSGFDVVVGFDVHVL